MDDLSKYMNDLLAFSPLITNLIYVRDFLTTDRSGSLTQVEIPSITLNRTMSFNEARNFSADGAIRNADSYEDDHEPLLEVVNSNM
jgi:hypothetical protein